MNNLTEYIYPSQRRVIMGKNYAVATSQPLATLAGMEMFLKGGNAVDAAVATAITLTVVEPTSNGIGGDAFAIVYDGKIHGLNASGFSPESLNLSMYDSFNKIPLYGWLSVTVPGVVSAWYCLWQKWGKLPFEQLFEPAIRYANSGFPVSPITAMAWQKSANIYLSLKNPQFDHFKKVFFPNNKAPEAGEIWGSKLHAETLKEIAQTGGESFYRGKLAEKIANFSSDTGGFLTLEDLRNHQAEWVTPIHTNYRDLTVWEIPPNTQGIATLMALNILENFDIKQYKRESVESYHLQIEAMKLALTDVYRYIGDPNFLEVGINQLLSKDYAKKRAELITEKALKASPGIFGGGTVYLTTADQDLKVSYIQSNYTGFGSGLLIPETGITLQNRGACFNLEANHPNQIAPKKRPFHTIIPGFITKENKPLFSLGVMGGYMQPQGQLQVIVNLTDYNMNPQTALDAPRWNVYPDNTVKLEPTVSPLIAKELTQREHNIDISDDISIFGKGQIISTQNDILIAASEYRADGLALAG